jgi:exodeoxyribonuclease VII small subunit
MTRKSEPSKKSFEASLSSLEQVVRELERGELPLEESLKLFEDGVRLARECQERLNQAERRIEVLMRDGNGGPAVRDFDQARQDSAEESPTISDADESVF